MKTLYLTLCAGIGILALSSLVEKHVIVHTALNVMLRGHYLFWIASSDSHQSWPSGFEQGIHVRYHVYKKKQYIGSVDRFGVYYDVNDPLDKYTIVIENRNQTIVTDMQIV